MEPRKLAAAIVSILNDGAEKIEKLMAQDGDDAKTDDDEKPTRRSRASKDKDDEDDDKETARPSRAGKSKTKPKDDDDDDDDDDDKDGDDDDDDKDGKHPLEAEVVRAARGALKVLETVDVAKIIKKYGKAPKATEVKPHLRRAVIDALEQAVIDET